MTEKSWYIKDDAEAVKAFDNAITSGLLSLQKADDNYAGNYMYMYTDQGMDFFKHKLTRKYIGTKEEL